MAGERAMAAEASRERAAAAMGLAAAGQGLYNGRGITRRKSAFEAAAEAAVSSSGRVGLSRAVPLHSPALSRPPPPWASQPGLTDLAALAPPLPLPRLIHALGLAEKDVCNIWCGGSRLWGCAHDGSDFDLYVVHRSKDPSLRIATCRLRKPALVDATLLHADEWAERLRLHNPVWTLLICHPLPWMLRLDPAALGYEMTPQVLSNAMLSHSLREWARVRKCFVRATPDVAGGRETLLHLLRTYVLTTQLCAHKRVVDFRAAEALRHELGGYASPEWSWWRDSFEPRLEAMHAELRAASRRETADETSPIVA